MEKRTCSVEKYLYSYNKSMIFMFLITVTRTCLKIVASLSAASNISSSFQTIWTDRGLEKNSYDGSSGVVVLVGSVNDSHLSRWNFSTSKYTQFVSFTLSSCIWEKQNVVQDRNNFLKSSFYSELHTQGFQSRKRLF